MVTIRGLFCCNSHFFSPVGRVYYYKKEVDGVKKVIYLAGGCFWGLEHLMQSLRGVVDAESGYANGRSEEFANYAAVCTGLTGFRETVKVEYDDEVVSLETLLAAYFAVIDPTLINRQGMDMGTQYQTGIYYTDAESRAIVERVAAEERKKHPRFYVELRTLENFYPAEEYHQDYLIKNPHGYCHISPAKMAQVRAMVGKG